MALVITGTIITFDPERPVVERGAVYVGDGTVVAVRRRDEPAPAGFDDADVVHTRGFVYPGLIDLHNHLAYNFLPLWHAPRDEPYQTRYQWPNAATYGRDVSNPAQAMGIAAAAATLRYAEVRAIVGGVTAIQGSPVTTIAFPGWMVRNVEKERFEGGPAQTVYQSVIWPTAEQQRRYATELAKGRSYICHLAEGTDPKLRDEFEQLHDTGCVQAGLIGIHSTALTKADYARWTPPGTVVWSPFSNLWLYAGTTDVLEARRRGISVCLGSDWGPSGTRNVLGELKVADLWNRRSLDGELNAQDLCEMVTVNPGDALARAWGRPVGQIVEGALADLACTMPVKADPYDSLVAASERHVRLVVVGGRPAYGTPSLLRDAGSTSVEIVSVAGVRRGLDMTLPPERLPDNPALAARAEMSWADGIAAMEAVRRDPFGAVMRARDATPRGEERLEFVPDMPAPGGGDEAARALTEDELRELVIPPFPRIAHDAAFFDEVEAGALHGGALDGLHEYW